MGDLIPTPEAAKRLGISARTIQRYVEKGYVTPDLILESGQYRWNFERLRQQIQSMPWQK